MRIPARSRPCCSITRPDTSGSVARDEDEHLGRVGESHRLEGEPRQEAAPVDMVYKDTKEGNAAKEIKPKVAF